MTCLSESMHVREQRTCLSLEHVWEQEGMFKLRACKGTEYMLKLKACMGTEDMFKLRACAKLWTWKYSERDCSLDSQRIVVPEEW